MIRRSSCHALSWRDESLPSPFPLPRGEGEEEEMKREGDFADSYFLSLWERTEVRAKTMERNPMHKKITRRTFCSMLLALPFPAQAQQAGKVPRIVGGVLQCDS